MEKEDKTKIMEYAKREFDRSIKDVMEGCKKISGTRRFNFSVSFSNGDVKGMSWEDSSKMFKGLIGDSKTSQGAPAEIYTAHKDIEIHCKAFDEGFSKGQDDIINSLRLFDNDFSKDKTSFDLFKELAKKKGFDIKKFNEGLRNAQVSVNEP